MSEGLLGHIWKRGWGSNTCRFGRCVQVPIYDFKESRRVGYRTVDVPESRVVILEGIYALSQRIRCSSAVSLAPACSDIERRHWHDGSLVDPRDAVVAVAAAAISP